MCRQVLTAESFKKNQIKKHLDKVHSHLSSKPLADFENLEAGVKKQRLENMKNVTFDQRTTARASLEVAWLIGRNKKPQTIGEEPIKPAAVKMVEIMCGHDYFKRLNSVPLSAKIIKHRISIWCFINAWTRQRFCRFVTKREFQSASNSLHGTPTGASCEATGTRT